MLQKLILNSIVFKQQLDAGISQAQLIEQVAQLGMTNFEIRREFLINGIEELQTIKAQADQHHMQLFYSINEDLMVNHQLNPLLSTFIEEAKLLQVPFIKLNIGDASQITIEALKPLAYVDVDIRVENNQTLGHANIINCQKMMQLCHAAQLPITFVFDTANWVFVGDDIQQAVDVLAQDTRYLHCKNYRLINQAPQVTSSLFEGQINIVQLLSQFQAIEYYALEYPSTMAILAQDIAQLVKII